MHSLLYVNYTSKRYKKGKKEEAREGGKEGREKERKERQERWFYSSHRQQLPGEVVCDSIVDPKVMCPLLQLLYGKVDRF